MRLVLSHFAKAAHRNSVQSVLFAASCAWGLIWGIRLLGLLYASEIALQDRFFQLRSPEPSDQRIVAIGITEADLQRYGWPLSDQHLADLLETVYAGQPRVVGLDLYRDTPIAPGRQRLAQLLRHQRNLIGIELLPNRESGEGVRPNPLLADRQAVGFNNLAAERDSTIRRGLLLVRHHNKIYPSFAFLVAQRYLEGRGVDLTVTSTRGEIQIMAGEQPVPRFSANDGYYVNERNTAGYQFLANFRGRSSYAHLVSMHEVLSGQVPRSVFNDRIVIIGSNSPSLRDIFPAPYLRRSAKQTLPSIPGFLLQTDLTSQLVSAALDDRAFFRVLPEWIEALWLGIWCIVGACAALRLRLLWLLGSGMMLSVAFVGFGFSAFLSSWLIPILPPLLGMSSSAFLMVLYLSHVGRELRRSTNFLASIIDAIPDPVFVKDGNLRWIVINEAYSRLIGYPADYLIAKSERDIFANHEAKTFQTQDEIVFRSGETREHVETLTDAIGNCRIVETKRSIHRDAFGNVFLIGILRDITEHKRNEERLKQAAADLAESNAELKESAGTLLHQANHDMLTGLPNRKFFFERLQNILTWADNNEKAVGLMFLDLDGFKAVNDTLGHAIGDLLLIAVAKRLVSSLRGSDTVARLGGDEFTVILPGLGQEERLATIAQKLTTALSQPFHIAGHPIQVTTSLGISIYPQDARLIEELVQHADEAMFEAKKDGKNCYRFAAIGTPDANTCDPNPDIPTSSPDFG